MKALTFKGCARIVLDAVITAFLLSSTGLPAGLHPRGQDRKNNQAQSRGKRGIETKKTDINSLPGAAKRWALIIGIDKYDDPDINSLGGAVKDAKTLKQALIDQCSFAEDHVILLTSDSRDKESKPTKSNIIDKLSGLDKEVKPDGLLLFAFSGHGIDVNGQAFLLPMESKLSRDPLRLTDDAVSVERVKEYINRTGVRQRIMFLDACRNKLSASRGIDVSPLSEAYEKAFEFDFERKNSKIDAFLTFYATEKGQESWEDQDTGQGYFTEAIVDALHGGPRGETLSSQGEVTLGALTKYVREAVAARAGKAGKNQVPYPVTDGYGDDLVLAKVEMKRPGPAEKGASILPGTAMPSTDVEAASEITYWNGIVNKTNPELFKNYLDDFPAGRFVKLARSFLADLEKPYWQSVANTKDEQALRRYLEIYPDGQFVRLARNNIKLLDNARWKTIAATSNPDDLDTYLKDFPSGQHADIAKKRLAKLSNNTETSPAILATRSPVIASPVPAASAGTGAVATSPSGTKPSNTTPESTSPPKATSSPAASSSTTPPASGAPAATAPSATPATSPVGTSPITPATPPVTSSTPESEAVNKAARAEAVSLPSLPLQSFAFTTIKLRPSPGHNLIEESHAAYYPEDIGNGVTIRMVEVPRGAFLMGDPASVTERPQHSVNIKSFFMGEFEITQEQWRTVARLPRVKIDLDPDPSYIKGDDFPVGGVSWDETVEFCERLSRKTGRKYRLPSEAEWEYACRAGSLTQFAFGDNITAEYVNFDGEHPYKDGPSGVRRSRPVSVGSLGTANAFGLYDMHGNALEWCSDLWHDNYNGAPTDGRSWDVGPDTSRVLRGGDWTLPGGRSRSSARTRSSPETRSFSWGFRVAMDVN